MTEGLGCLKCTFLILLIVTVISIFIGIQLEEMLYDYKHNIDYGVDEEEPVQTTIPTVFPVITHVQLPNHNQADPALVEDLASKIIPPVPPEETYFLRKPQVERIGDLKSLRFLDNRGGNRTFIECGAGDGESLANTLPLERYSFWSGLLVEADPVHLNDIIRVRRKAWIAPVCMSLNTSAYVANFMSSRFFEGRVLTENDTLEGVNVVKVVCYPFYTFILARNLKRIDYFSLSVQGHEMEILETIPFHKVDIGFISVDFSKARGGYDGVTKFMKRHGYDVLQEYPSSELLFVNIDEDYW